VKIAQLLYSGLGGHGSVAFSLIAGDTEHRWSNALCFIGVEPLLPAYQARCEQLNIPHAYAPVRSGRPWQSWAKVRRWLNDQRPDALIVHSTTILPPCIAYARRHHIPLITVEHHSVALKRRQDWLLSAAAVALGDRVVMLSSAFATAVERRLGKLFWAQKVVVIPNGVDLDLFAPATRTPSGPFRIGMAARFTPAKRHDLLLEVVRRLTHRSPSIDWRLSFAGAGETQDAVRGLAGDLGESVRFEGNLDETKLADWYRSLRIYALASDGEAFSTSIIQAMATALPIVASNASGVREQVPDEFGILVANDDPDAWVKAITALVEDKQLASCLGQAGRQICEERYSAVAMHGAYDRVIREAAQSAKGRR
jgi:glycosyltransferase involved in cell wall biosynthesis